MFLILFCGCLRENCLFFRAYHFVNLFVGFLFAIGVVVGSLFMLAFFPFFSSLILVSYGGVCFTWLFVCCGV